MKTLSKAINKRNKKLAQNVIIEKSTREENEHEVQPEEGIAATQKLESVIEVSQTEKTKEKVKLKFDL